MKYVYVFLTRTGTKVANVIGAVTGDRFAHASISLDRELTQMYSFGRRRVTNPLYGGFIKENIHQGIFALFGECNSVLYRIPVTEDTYSVIENTLHTMHRRRFSYRYNFVGLFSCAFGVPTNTRTHFTCSQFVSWILEYSGATTLPKNMGLMKPDDLTRLPNAELVYEGCIANADNMNRTVAVRRGARVL
jgi:hypothetical protein